MFQFWCCEATRFADKESLEFSFRAAPVLTKRSQQELDSAEAESTVIDEESLPFFPRSSKEGQESARKDSNESLGEKSTEAGSESLSRSDMEFEFESIRLSSGLRGRRGLGELSCQTDGLELPQVSEALKVAEPANFKSKRNSFSHGPIHRQIGDQGKCRRSIFNRRGASKQC
jgi:hypothetical protein